MAEFILRLGNQEANTLETAMLFYSFSSVLHQCFLIMLVLLKLHNKRENAPTHKKKHSRNTIRKGR